MSTQTLKETLDRLERAVQIDERVALTDRHALRIPEGWAAKVRVHLDQLADIFYNELLPKHADQFKQIRQEDVALQPRITEMQAVDRDIAAAIEATRAKITNEKASEKLDSSRVAAIVNDVQSLGRRIRDQQDAVSKWFSEAFLRDRGFPSS